MDTRKILLAIGAAGLLSAPAVAASAAAAGTTAAPPSGTYRLSGDLKGSFQVKGTRITHFHATLTKTAETPCGTGTIAAAQALTAIHATGTDPEGSHYAFWAVGRNEPSADPVIQPTRAKFDRNGKTITGSIDFGMQRHGAGNIYYDHAGCDLQFEVSH
jgi:hypothetical protein